MRDTLVGLAVLACPIGMGLMMWVMGKGMRPGVGKPAAAEPPSVEQLREEHRRLGAQIEQIETSHAAPLPSAR